MKMQYLKANLGQYIDEIFNQPEDKPFIMWSNIKISPIFAKSKFSDVYLRGYSIY